MMKILLKNELKSVLNSARSSKKSNMIAYVIAFLVMFGLLVFVSSMAWDMHDQLTEPMISGLLSMGFLAVIGFVLLLGVPQIFKDLYATGDLELLFTLPIKTKYIFWVKYLKSFLGIPLFVLIFFVIPLFTYGIAAKVSLLFYPVVLLTVLAVLIIGVSIAYLFNLILIQIIPASRANEFLTVMSLLSGLIVYLMFMLPTMFSDPSTSDMAVDQLPLLPDWVPSVWASNAIIEASNGTMQFILPFIMIVGLALISIIFATSLIEKGFRTGFIRLSEGGSKKKKKRSKRSKHKLNHPIIAVGKKEWFSIKRDAREWIVLMPFVFFIIFGGIGFFSGGGSLTDLKEFKEISWPIVQMLFLFIFVFTTGTVASSAIGREGPSLWILKTSPLAGKDIAYGKLWISWLIPLVLMTVIEIVVGLLLGWTIFQFIFGFIIKAFITIGLSSIGLWLGTLGARYNPKNPQQRVNFTVSLYLMLMSVVYLVIMALPYAYVIVPAEFLVFPADVMADVGGFKGTLLNAGVSLLLLKAKYTILMNTIGVIVLGLMSFGLTRLFVSLTARKIDKGINIELVSQSNAKPLFGRKKSGNSLY